VKYARNKKNISKSHKHIERTREGEMLQDSRMTLDTARQEASIRADSLSDAKADVLSNKKKQAMKKTKRKIDK